MLDRMLRIETEVEEALEQQGNGDLRLGATLTTLYLQFEKEAEAALGLPSRVHSYALLPIG